MSMTNTNTSKLLVAALTSSVAFACADADETGDVESTQLREGEVEFALSPQNLPTNLVERGKDIFRNETWNDEAFWTDELELHEAIEEQIDPITALSLGLKVDSEALADAGIDLGDFDLTDPATTVALLKADAVIGLKGTFVDDEFVSVGVTCALCHTDVNSSTGIGERIDGAPNRELDVGMILAMSPTVSPAQKAVFEDWGPGFYDPRWNFFPIETSVPVLIPPASGLAGVALATYTADGTISYWNNYVSVTQMGGQGVFVDPRIDVAVHRTPDLVHRDLPALLAYQLSLEAREPEPGSFNPDAAEKGKMLFNGKADCARCHIPEMQFTDIRRNGTPLWAPEEIDQDGAYAARSATGEYRTTPLRELGRRNRFFHDGSAEGLTEVVDHYDDLFALGLSGSEKNALIEYLKTL